MVTHQGCPQTPGRRRGPIPAMCQYQGSPVSSRQALAKIHVLAANRDSRTASGASGRGSA